MKKTLATIVCGAAVAVSLAACGSSKKEVRADDQRAAVTVPAFDGQRAYEYVKRQVDFGPRLLGSEAHKACGDFLCEQLEAFGAKVYRQIFQATIYDGTTYRAVNIIGAFNPEARKRVMLCSHWDSRPWADNDPDPKNHHTPILGANDGASGVGVLLEMARHFKEQMPTIGVDIILFDAEDYGAPQFADENGEEWWCLGSQYWSRIHHVANYNARYGVLLDMVGGRNATFLLEGFSKEYAHGVQQKIWDKAQELGFGSVFVRRAGGFVTDDHVPVNRVAKIPCVDIVNCDEQSKLSGFGDTWHTVNDNMEHIDKQTLQMVGQTLMEVLYNER